jgi:cytoskeletal protein CcmA (bactofilin family)
VKLSVQQPKRLNNQSGMALVYVLLILVVISVMGLSIMGLAANNVKMSSGERNYQSTYYIAESGITYTMNDINAKIQQAFIEAKKDENAFYTLVNSKLEIGVEKIYSDFDESFGQKPVAKVKISNPEKGKYFITSTGTINNRSRKVERSFKINWSPNISADSILNKGVLVSGKIDLSGGGNIDGDVRTNEDPSSIILGWGANITGEILAGPNKQNKEISNNVKKYAYTANNPVIDFILPIFPQVFPSGKDMGTLKRNGGMSEYTINMDQDLKYSEINLDNGTSLNINLMGKDSKDNKNLIVDKLNLPNGFIRITGTGKLTIYVKDTITMNNGAINGGIKGASPGNTEQLEIYYKGAILDLPGSTKIYGSLFAESANITFKQGAGIQGHIISLGTSIIFDGGSTAELRLFYAPLANISFTGGPKLKGSVIAKSMSMSGGGTITGGIPNIDNLSFFQGSGTGGAASIGDLTSIREVN